MVTPEEVIDDIEALYAQSILKIYSFHTHCSYDKELDLRRTGIEYIYPYGSCEIIFEPEPENKILVTIISPIPLDKRIRDILSRKIHKINEIYICGFLGFIELTNGNWFEPITEISIEGILGIRKAEKVNNSRIISFTFRCPQSFEGIVISWLNLYLYEFRKRFPSIRKQKQITFERENYFLDHQLQDLKSKFSIDMETEIFHTCRKRIDEITRRLNMDFEEYYSKRILRYTSDDENIINLLKIKGFPVPR